MVGAHHRGAPPGGLSHRTNDTAAGRGVAAAAPPPRGPFFCALLSLGARGPRLIDPICNPDNLGAANQRPHLGRRVGRIADLEQTRSPGQPLGEDVHKLFLQLTSLTEAVGMTRMLASPFSLFPALIEKIKRETKNAEAGKDARIIVKINSLNELQLIDALYEASQAGVKIDMIIRGICSLRPGIKGLSENIHVRSIVGRFLEHSRVYYFLNDGDEEFYCSSADWMERNLLRRNESCFPVRQKTLKEQLKRDLDLYLADNSNAWVLHGDGSYERLVPGDREPVSAQDTLLQLLASPSS